MEGLSRIRSGATLVLTASPIYAAALALIVGPFPWLLLGIGPPPHLPPLAANVYGLALLALLAAGATPRSRIRGAATRR